MKNWSESPFSDQISESWLKNESRHLVRKSRLATIRQVDLQSVRHYGVSRRLSGFRLAQLSYAIGLRSHGAESYICFDEMFRLTHEQ